MAAVDHAEAADWLGITPTQVGRQKAKIIDQLEAETFPQAVILAYEQGLITPNALPTVAA